MKVLPGARNGEAGTWLELGQVQQQAGLGRWDGAAGGEHGPGAGTEPLDQGKVEDGQELYCKFRRANLVEGKVGEEGQERQVATNSCPRLDQRNTCLSWGRSNTMCWLLQVSYTS